MHEIGDTFADVTEGNPEVFGFIWERLRYDWSRPGSVKATVVDSNIFRPGSTWELRATPLNGGSRVEIIGIRYVRGVKGAIIGFYIWSGLAKKVVQEHLRHFLSKLEEHD